MDTQSIVALLQDLLYLIIVFAAALLYAMVRGRAAVVNLILGLYFALLISLKFPYYDALFGNFESRTIPMIALFAFFTIAATFMFGRLMPTDSYESAFEGFWKKILFALMASILIMAYSYHVLPVTDLITPGSHIQEIFAPQDRFFWWLIIPLIGLFFL
ncbi:hypothetical protein GW943_01775 [Candidatus Parcubacteria bacterium]|uniref:CvpA family protein n=1 Tax=Candidatus Kaiserbacteria bacterium CG10_big_fil_rev_8_21_14_0_10_47_16 TaxID=1974608 RepID=A0A2H0UEE0_9BACT|nr:hypothetical protein [Candidatus Parcubacteria bacterium]PIR84761.1 MAG: hypothetical protein COU16_01065 [Candidatus Kaiserbacteria bacterium CG10_big_fil_rev_8_21_14_0_10_47_16]